jgi:hypothetical protein
MVLNILQKELFVVIKGFRVNFATIGISKWGDIHAYDFLASLAYIIFDTC